MEPLKITRQMLSEMEDLAIACPFDIIKYDYRETQQLLTLYSLEQLLTSMNIASPFTIKELLNEKRSDRTDEED